MTSGKLGAARSKEIACFISSAYVFYLEKPRGLREVQRFFLKKVNKPHRFVSSVSAKEEKEEKSNSRKRA